MSPFVSSYRSLKAGNFSIFQICMIVASMLLRRRLRRPPMVACQYHNSATASPMTRHRRGIIITDGIATSTATALDVTHHTPQRHRTLDPHRPPSVIDAEFARTPAHSHLLSIWRGGDEEVPGSHVGRDPDEECRRAAARRLDLVRMGGGGGVAGLNSWWGRAPSPDDFARAMGEVGVDERDPVVVYDRTGTLTCAARGWYLISELYGHADTRVLSGAPPPPPAQASTVTTIERKQYALPMVNDNVTIAYPQMLQLVSDYLSPRRPTIIDCRPHERFAGLEAENVVGLASGHVPGAVNVDWRRLVDVGGGLVDERRIIEGFKSARVDLDRDLIVMGHDGFAACVLFLALRVLGKDSGVRLYEGGWVEWASKPPSPISHLG